MGWLWTLKTLIKEPQSLDFWVSGVWEGLGAVSAAILGHLGSKVRLEAAVAIFGRPWKGQDGTKMGPKAPR